MCRFMGRTETMHWIYLKQVLRAYVAIRWGARETYLQKIDFPPTLGQFSKQAKFANFFHKLYDCLKKLEDNKHIAPT